MEMEELQKKVELYERLVKLVGDYIELREKAEKYEIPKPSPIPYIPIYPQPSYPYYPWITWTWSESSGTWVKGEK
jgi:hypothetical protein